MNRRSRIFGGVLASLAVVYVVWFTEWLRPAPIQIASQVRFAIQPPRFGRPVKKPLLPGQAARTNQVSHQKEIELIGRPEKGSIDQSPAGVANVTFSLDDWYSLTEVKVQDVPADGSKPQVLWQLVGKSRPVNSLLYGREPSGMRPLLQGSTPEPLKAGVPYRLIVQSGRRRGTNDFRTTELHLSQE
jgi:hypothetical protein